ncbi:MAG: fibronectin type III domain-containing protein [Acidimicrobiales bacterium]
MRAELEQPAATGAGRPHRRTMLRRCRGTAFATVLAAGVLAGTSSAASAATAVTLYVAKSGTATSGCTASKPCATIADGIEAAESLSGDTVTIDVAASTTHYDENLTVEDTTNPSLTIKGAGATSTTLDGSSDGTPDLEVGAGVVTISGLSIVNGVASYPGGGVENSATLTLSGDTLSGDSGTYGGAIHNTGTLTLTGDTISRDDGSEGGGGLYNQGPATLDDDTFSQDSGYDGDGVFNTTATLTGSGDTFSSDSGADEGGGLYNASGDVTLADSTFSDNSAVYGGAAFNYTGHLTLTGGTLSGDKASAEYGGGVANYTGTVILTDETVSGDTAATDGAGVFSEGSATLTDDTLSGDKASSGGGVFSDGTLLMTNDTLFGDEASSEGGGIYSGDTATLTDDTLSQDTASDGGGIVAFETVTVASSILEAAPCAGIDFSDGGHNVESDDSCGFGATSKVNSHTIALAAALARNGSKGPETLAIAPGSSAYDEVPSAHCTVGTDERGMHRPGELGQSACDAGAFEFQSSVASPAQHVRATARNKSITLHWSAPASNGGLAVSGYNAYCSKTRPVSTKGPPGAKVSGKDYSATLKGLKNGTKYYCVVLALNAKGTSSPSSTVTTTPKK